MQKIIGDRSTGKTKKLLEYASKNNFVVVCKDTNRMREKAYAYNIFNLTFCTYSDYAEYVETCDNDNKFAVIDDIDDYIRYVCPNVVGFTMSLPDKLDKGESNRYA